METHEDDPYEQQLLLVYESCLEKGKLGLDEEGLRALYDKLQLEERDVELIGSLLDQSCGESAISFDEFRNSLLKLLRNTQKSVGDSNENQAIDDDTPIRSSDKYSERVSLAFECHRLKQFYNDINDDDDNNDHIVIKNSPMMSILEESVISKRMLEQIFEKLDVDCDGRINFDEFLSLFQNTQTIEDDSLNLGAWNDQSIDESNSENHVTMLGPDRTSLVERRVVINLWQMAGISDATSLLRDLGFMDVEINLIELMTVINDELKSLEHELKHTSVTITHVNLLRGALVLYQEEVRSMNVLNDQLTCERNKLKADVAEANENANILAQENDENHMKLEKKQQEQIKQLELKHAELIKGLSMQNNSERETHIGTIKLLKEQLHNAQQEEQLIRSKLADALNENHALEIDNQSLIEQISKLKMSNNQLLRQVQILAAEHDEAERNEERDNEQVISLVDRIKKLQAESSLLRDQNDELTSEVESLRARSIYDKTKNCDVNTSLSDSEESNSVTDYEPLGKQVPELKVAITDDKATNLSSTIALIIHDLKNIALDRKTATCSSDCVLKRNLSDIIVSLESQILAKIPGRMDNLIKNGEEEYEERSSESLRDFVVNRNEKTRFITSVSNNCNEKNDDLEVSAKNKTPSLRDYPPKCSESHQSDQSRSGVDKNISLNIDNSSDLVDGIDTEAVQKDESKINALLQEQEVKYNNEKKQLQERCAKLESDLELLRTEYYQCEDYWAGKLEEERQLVEQEQKISDEKLGELIAKIAEYEEQFSVGEKTRNDGRLSPIEEKYNLEQQYFDLEKEYEQFKKGIEEIVNEKENLLSSMQKQLDDSKVEKVDSCVQVSDVEDSRTMKKNSMSIHYVLPNESSNVIGVSGQAVPNNTNHHGVNQKLFEPGKLNKIAEHSISNNKMHFLSSKVSARSSNNGFYPIQSQVNLHCTNDELARMQKVEVQRMSQKCIHGNIAIEYNSLLKQKECLIKEIMELENFQSNRFFLGVDGQVTKIDMNFIKSLMAKLQMYEQKKKSLQESLKHQKQYTEIVLKHIWKQHCNEVANLQHILKETENSLQHQLKMNAIFMEKLSKSDLLVKDLYVENAYLKANVERLGERCYMLVHLGAGSTSV